MASFFVSALFVLPFAAIASNERPTAQGTPMMLVEVAACATKECVEHWRLGEESIIKKFVPQALQSSAMVTMEKEYQENLARVTFKNVAKKGGDESTQAKMPSWLATEVDSCSTKKCVEEWRNSAETSIKKYLAEDDQASALASMQIEYQKNLARVAQQAAAGKTAKAFTSGMKNDLKMGGSFLASAGLSVALLALFAVVVLSLVSGIYALKSLGSIDWFLGSLTEQRTKSSDEYSRIPDEACIGA